MKSMNKLVIVAFIAAGLAGCTSEVTFSVPDMMCEESCAVKVGEILAEQPGVTRVDVDFPSKTATVVGKRSKFDANAAVAALLDHGFDSSQIKAADLQATPHRADAESTENPSADSVH